MSLLYPPKTPPPHPGGYLVHFCAHFVHTHQPHGTKVPPPKHPLYNFIKIKLIIFLKKNKNIFLFIETFKLSAPVICQTTIMKVCNERLLLFLLIFILFFY